jgi:NodT family efflux transporter outer membrane factor (OMF) lipoprotein
MLNNLSMRNLLCTAILSMIVMSCKIKQQTNSGGSSQIALPANYSLSIDTASKFSGDSASSATIRWKEFFSDTVLVNLIEEGLKNNFDLLIAYQNIEFARANYRGAKGAMAPALSGGLAFSQRKFGLYTMDGAGNITTEITPGKIVPIHLRDYYVGLQASWEVDIWGKLKNKKRAALARLLSTEEGKNLVVSNLIADIAVLYCELLAFDNELEVVRDGIKLQENAFELMQYQKQAGATNELVVKQFEVQLLNSKGLEKLVMQQQLECENSLNFLLGRLPQPINRGKMNVITFLPFDIKIGVPSRLLENRPDIRKAELELLASKADVKAAKAAFYPGLNIMGTGGFQAFRPDFLLTAPQSIAYGAFGSIMAPILNRSAYKAEFKMANAAQEQSLYNYQRTIVQGYMEVYNEIARINNLNDRYSLKKREVEAANKTVDYSTELFKSGWSNYLEVLMSQHNALASKLELTEVFKEKNLSAVRIYKALGGGWQ